MRTAVIEGLEDLVGDTPVSAAELCEQHEIARSLSTVSRALKALFDEGVLDRRWRGATSRFGCYEYRLRRG